MKEFTCIVGGAIIFVIVVAYVAVTFPDIVGKVCACWFFSIPFICASPLLLVFYGVVKHFQKKTT